MRKRKILFLIFRLERGGGAERVLLDQINGLNKELFDCFVCLLNGGADPDLLQEISLPEDRKNIIHFDSLLSFWSWIKLVSYFKKFNFDIIYSHLFFANFVGRLAGLISGIEFLVATEHNVYLNRGRFERLSNKILSRFSSQIVAVSNSVKEYLVEREGIRQEKISVIYNGVNLKKYLFNYQDRSIKRLAWGLTPEDFAVLSVGQVTKQKNYDLLVDIAYEINKVRGEKINFFVAGRNDDDFSRTLSERVDSLGLGQFFHFLGRSDDIPVCLSAADCLAMTSKWEGFGLALVEAMANGKPVLVNDISTLREITGANNEFGFVCKGTSDFVDYLISLKKDKLLYAKYHNLSLSRASSFSLESNLNKLTKLFLELK